MRQTNAGVGLRRELVSTRERLGPCVSGVGPWLSRTTLRRPWRALVVVFLAWGLYGCDGAERRSRAGQGTAHGEFKLEGSASATPSRASLPPTRGRGGLGPGASGELAASVAPAGGESGGVQGGLRGATSALERVEGQALAPTKGAGAPANAVMSELGLAELTLRRLVAASAVESREPVVPDGPFEPGQSVVAFVEVVSGPGQPHPMRVVFEQTPGREVAELTLEVPGARPRWRTWGRTRRVDRAGRWRVRVLTQGGRELGQVEFSVEE